MFIHSIPPNTLLKPCYLILSASFEDRQKRFRDQVARRASERHQASDAQAAGWFKPEITPESVSIVANRRPEQLRESAAEKAERMSKLEQREIERRRAERDKEVS